MADLACSSEGAGRPERTRGCHKVFLGYAAGVGKTYKMLSEARRRLSRGQDVVVGFVEPHRRPETMALLEGLECIPTMKVQYRGAILEELDTDAVIARRPELVLVDELAHTNAPGSAHAKRWQSVEQILDAGISVLSTVNVQHIESLNDKVSQITGVCVRETVPDRVLDEADEVEIVDLTPDALINRLKRGAVYTEERVEQALQHFFRRGNLVALREIALRKAAEEVDEELTEFMSAHDVDKTWGAEERVLVALTPKPLGMKLVRRGYRLAERMGGRLFSVFVRPPGLQVSARENATLEELRALTVELGGEFLEVSGADPAVELVRFARERQVTFIVMGQSARTRMDEVVRGSIVNRMMRETRNIDIVVVADPDRSETGGTTGT